MRLILSLSIALLLSSCGPNEGDACVAESDGAVCHGSEVLLCVCDEPNDDGECPDGDAHWELDSACGCDASGSMTCT